MVRISFDGKYDSPDDIDGDIVDQLEIAERQAGLEPTRSSVSAPRRLRILLDRLHRTTGEQAVVLIDEYDKPILDVIDRPEMAIANRDFLRGFYGIIKGSARDVRFVFVTGVSMFSRVSLFSGLNNLVNISLDPKFAAICGYTDRDLDTIFYRNFRDSTGMISGSGTTVITGLATKSSIIRSTFCCCSTVTISNPTGSRPALPLSCSG